MLSSPFIALILLMYQGEGVKELKITKKGRISRLNIRQKGEVFQAIDEKLLKINGSCIQKSKMR